jgi:hypothetical protein
MVRKLRVIIAVLAGIGLFLGMTPQPEQPAATQGQDQDAFQKFIAKTGRYYVAIFGPSKKGDDVLALLDRGELQKLDQSGHLQALLQGERGNVLVVLSAFTSDEARGLAGPLRGEKAKSVKLTIRPAIATKSFTDPKERKPVTQATMETFEAAYAVKGKAWVAEGNAMSRRTIPEHVSLVGSLFDKGVVKMYLSFEDSDDPRGFFVFAGKSRDEMRKHFANDPVIKEHWVDFDFISGKVPEGTFK